VRETSRSLPLPLYAESPPDAALDVAISDALMRGAGGAEALRLWTPPRVASFGRLDLLREGAAAAVEAARAAGFQPVRRLAGGRAAAAGPGTVCLGWASPDDVTRTQRRYEILSSMIVEALQALDVEARVGELDGEWCPGSWSVLAGGVKLGGLAQRVVRGRAWAEALIVVDAAPALRPALDRVQEALGVQWDAGTLGGVAGLRAGEVAEALAAVLRSRCDARPADLPPAAWREAERLRGQHVL
jgi:lipoate-protein ligase A